MKKSFLFLFAILSFTYTYGQSDHVITDPYYRAKIRKSARCPKVLIDLSSGLNNNGGLLGVGADYHFLNDISVNGGMGIISTWGFKFYGGLKFHLAPCHTGWALGGGLTYNTGLSEAITNLSTSQGEQTVRLRYLPQTNMFVSGYRSWYVGRNRNRMFLQLGYSIPLTARKYDQLSGAPLSASGSRAVKSLSPGGFILALGFSIGTY